MTTKLDQMQAVHLPAVRAGGRRVSITRKHKAVAPNASEEMEDTAQTQDYPRPLNHEHHEHDDSKEGYKNRRERRKSSTSHRNFFEPLVHGYETPAMHTPNKSTMHIKQPAGRGLN
ncbi:hypothetical protein E3Q22_01392 [Wallemia mellicola]|uniref:Uncharacterized protein n=1 Tax=Wallemia mellicola TaxID=1708541 RepID=A0A4T0MDH0_9BASI|nr:hypothetical protein E3Q23_00365 [Wallemia mellicola]TIB81160.1 hypothetical protein E3Q22_01392 [Wallemia mellicola]TIB84341.1 hypothetical protein E3Q21_02417 [Wallemia mellicola]TIB87493.1 hypothetical protein E3Q20_02454 [Wallemia mellicola]TIC04861.1 hypothetical protein E3Q16_02537 [Wallemia mellicola]